MATKVGSTVNLGLYAPFIQVDWNYLYYANPSGERNSSYLSRICYTTTCTRLFDVNFYFQVQSPMPSMDIKIEFVSGGNRTALKTQSWTNVGPSECYQCFMTTSSKSGANGDYCEVRFYGGTQGVQILLLIGEPDPDNPIGVTDPYFKSTNVF